MAITWKGYTWEERQGAQGGPGVSDWEAGNVTLLAGSGGNIPVSIYGSPLDANQSRNARDVITAAYEYTDIAEESRRRTAARLALAAAMHEAALLIYANQNVPNSLELYYEAVGSNGRSVGIMQQQVGPGFQYPDTLAGCAYVMDVKNSTTLLIDRFIEFHPTDWWTADPGTVIWDAQQAGDPDYGTKVSAYLDEADAILAHTGFPVAAGGDVIEMKLTNPTGNDPKGCQISVGGLGGYGTYECVIEGNWSQMHAAIVWGGMFTYGGGQPGFNEIDACEISAWGANANPRNMEHTLWYGPYVDETNDGNYSGASWVPPNGKSTHRIIWTEGSVICRSWAGTDTSGAPAVETVWTTAGGFNIPVPAGESLIFNLWAFQGGYQGAANAAGATPFTAYLHDFSFVAAGGGGTPPPAGSMASLQDDFATKDTAKWTWGATATQATANGGQAFLPGDAYGTAASIISTAAYDLTNSSVVIDLAAVPSTVSGDGPYFIFSTFSGATVDAGDRYRWLLYMGSGFTHLTPQFFASGNATNTPTAEGSDLNYSGTTHRYIRIRHNGTAVVFETSSDGTTWAAHPFTQAPGVGGLTTMKAAVIAGADADNTGAFTLNAVNPTAVTPPPPDTDAGSPAVPANFTRAIADDFAGYATTAWPAPNNDTGAPGLSPAKDGSSIWEVQYNSSGTMRPLLIGTEGDHYLVYGDTTGAKRALFLSRGSAPGEVDFTFDLQRAAAATDPLQDARFYWGYAAYGSRFSIRLTSFGWAIVGPAGTQLDFADETAPIGTKVRWRVQHTAGSIKLYRNGTLIRTITAAVQAGRIGFEASGESVGRIYGMWADIPGAVVEPPPDPVLVKPGEPASFTATGQVQSARLDWTPPTTGGAVEGYTLQRAGSNEVITLGSDVLSYLVSGLTQGEVYSWTLKAVNSAGSSNGVTATATPTAPAPSGSTPSEPLDVLVALNGASGEVLVSWTAPALPNGAIRSYQVADQLGNVRATTYGELSAVATGLDNGSSYQFKVRAEDDETPGVFGAWSTLSVSISPNASGTATTALHERSTLGARTAPAGVTTLEQAIGQRLQPATVTTDLSAPPSAAWRDQVLAAGSRPLVRLGLTQSWEQLKSGELHTELQALMTWVTATTETIFIAPLPSPNDPRNPWSLSYSSTVPGFDSQLDAGIDTMTEYKRAFDFLVRFFRAGGVTNVRFVWEISVDPQESSQDNDWTAFYPGAGLADVIMLAGFNYGDGPGLLGTGQTVWRTPAEVFDAAYEQVGAISSTKPVWLMTASHEPALAYSGPSGDLIADAAHDKAAWITSLLTATTWPRVQAVIWNNEAGSRNWPLTSTTAARDAVRATVAGGVNWTTKSSQQTPVGDYMRTSVRALADWARSGARPATVVNPYERPDKRNGAAISVVFGLPYSAGAKSTGYTVTAADMLQWNRVHQMVLVELARNGAQGWAYASGELAQNHPVLLWGSTRDGAGRVVLDGANDAIPGAKMQVEGGFIEPDAGPGAPFLTAPQASVSTDIGGLYNDPTSQIRLDWTPLTSADFGGYEISGYAFGWDTTAAHATKKTHTGPALSPTTAPQPYVWDGLVASATYEVWVEVVMTDGTKARTTRTATTAAVVAAQKPSAPLNVKATWNGSSVDVTWAEPSNVGSSAITGYHVSRSNPYWDTKQDADGATPLGAAVRTYNLTNFTAGQQYTFEVWALNDAGEGLKGSSTITIPQPTPVEGTGGSQGMPTDVRLAGAYVPEWLYNPINVNGFHQNHNYILPFSAKPDDSGSGKFVWTSQVPTNLATARGRGVRVVLSCGGAGQGFSFDTKAQCDAFVQSIVAINTQWGGSISSPAFDGVDFNTFEHGYTKNAANYVYMGRELKRIFGSKFIVTAPPAPGNGGIDHALCKAMLAAENPRAFDFVTPQYYDGGLATYDIMVNLSGASIPWWVQNIAGGDASRIGVGFGLASSNTGHYMTAALMDTIWADLESMYPNLAGAFIWQMKTDVDLGNPYAINVVPDIKSR